MSEPPVHLLVSDDRWTGHSGELDTGPFLLRFREPVLGPADVEGYSRCLRIVWAYADEGSGAIPDPETLGRIQTFENRLCEALEHDRCAALTAVLTFDGATQWVLYTGNVPDCGQRINAMPQEEKPYPIELDAFEDPEWTYLRDEILGPVKGDA